MGTRHMQKVISKKGEVKLNQYGQWDGYPSGQGVNILEYLLSANLNKYQENLEKIPLITEDQIKDIEEKHSSDWKEHYPYLSRDCGSNIHQMIEDGSVKFVRHETDESWCEGFYEINFQTNTFKSEFNGIEKTYDLDKLPSIEQYLEDMSSSDDDED